MIRAETNGYGRVSLLDGSLILSEWYEMSEGKAQRIANCINGTSRAAEVNREAVAVCEQISRPGRLLRALDAGYSGRRTATDHRGGPCRPDQDPRLILGVGSGRIPLVAQTAKVVGLTRGALCSPPAKNRHLCG